MILKNIRHSLTVAALAVGLSIPAFGQIPGGGEQPDQVDQLAQMLDLSDDQQTEIRAVIDEISPQIEDLQTRAQEVQEELREQSGPDFDEAEIRETAGRLGDLTGEMTALSVILQSRVDGIFTEEQRERLEELERQQREMQQQMQQQQMQQQLQQQMQQQQQGPQGGPPQEIPAPEQP